METLKIKDKVFIIKPNCYKDVINCNNSVSYHREDGVFLFTDEISICQKPSFNFAKEKSVVNPLVFTDLFTSKKVDSNEKEITELFSINTESFSDSSKKHYKIQTPLNNEILNSFNKIHFSLSPIIENENEILEPECYNILWYSNISGFIGRGKSFDTYLMSGTHNIMIILGEQHFFNDIGSSVNIIKDEIVVIVK